MYNKYNTEKRIENILKVKLASFIFNFCSTSISKIQKKKMNHIFSLLRFKLINFQL